MPDILTQLLNVSTIVFCLAIFALVWIQRKTVETVFPAIVDKKYWREFLVPAGPIGTGGIIAAVVTSYPYPDMFKETWSARTAFGIFCGLFSGFLYRMVKKNIMDKFGVAPPPPPATPSPEPTDQIQ